MNQNKTQPLPGVDPTPRATGVGSHPGPHSTQAEPLSLHKKLLEIRKSCEFLKKENNGQEGLRFKYVASSQTLQALRRKMDELGVLLVPNVTGHSVTEHPTKGGGKQFMTSVDFTFTWINVDNPVETLECRWYGQGMDAGEKGVGKAATYAEKYFLLKFFNIATDADDPDANQNPPKLEGKKPATRPAHLPNRNQPRPQQSQQPQARNQDRLPENPRQMHAKKQGKCMLSKKQILPGDRIIYSSKTGLVALEDEYNAALMRQQADEQMETF